MDAVTRCAQALGPDRRFFGTADTVADLEQLRETLGVEKLTLIGASYGTLVAARYAIAHPDHVARLVLDSVVPHDGLDPAKPDKLSRPAARTCTACGAMRLRRRPGGPGRRERLPRRCPIRRSSLLTAPRRWTTAPRRPARRGRQPRWRRSSSGVTCHRCRPCCLPANVI
ncbi:MAG: alpha/beta fold hydrolase [Pseudonocardia sp.]|nr:alpha/beta fold hydrolase [Pseudonocardia sp.]